MMDINHHNQPLPLPELKVFWQFKVKVIKLQSRKFANLGLYCLSCALEAWSVTGLLGVILDLPLGPAQGWLDNRLGVLPQGPSLGHAQTTADRY